MCNGLEEAGAEVKLVYDPDPSRVENFLKAFPGAKAARTEAEVLEDPAIRLVAGAAVPDARGELGLRVMDHGKDYFTDKPPLTTLEQIDAAREKAATTGRKYAVYYSERIHNEAAVFAEKLVADGAVGRVVQVIGTGPHRISIPQRPDWFFDKKRYGGIIVDLGCHQIIVDLGCHQIEQFLFYSGARDAAVLHSKTANYKFKQYPHFEDFGDATLLADNGAVCYLRVDWLTPDGLGAWGDGRTFILGTEGYIEMRKYIDVARSKDGDQVFLVDHQGERNFFVTGQVGFPYFGRLVRDCLDRTDKAFSQELFFRATELAVIAQLQAVRIE